MSIYKLDLHSDIASIPNETKRFEFHIDTVIPAANFDRNAGADGHRRHKACVPNLASAATGC